MKLNMTSTQTLVSVDVSTGKQNQNKIDLGTFVLNDVLTQCDSSPPHKDGDWNGMKTHESRIMRDVPETDWLPLSSISGSKHLEIASACKHIREL